MGSLDGIARWPVDNAAAAGVADGGVVQTYGDTARVYPLASVTKLLVAYGALVAVEEGAIELDQPAGPPGATVRHLLAHASGLAFDSRRVQAAPGVKRIYSSAGFEALAECVEHSTDIPFGDYLAEGVFGPLGMGNTALSGPAGHGGLSCVADMARFATELFAPALVSPGLLAEATAVQFPGLAGVLPGYGKHRANDWGLGFEVRGHKSPHWTGVSNSPETFGHFGQSGTFLWCDPRVGKGLVVLTDRPFGDWAKPLWPVLSDKFLSDISG